MLIVKDKPIAKGFLYISSMKISGRIGMVITLILVVTSSTAQPVHYLFPNNRHASINDVWATENGDSVWAATSKGICLFTNNGHNQTAFLPDFNAQRIVRNANAIWIAGIDSVVIYSNGQWTTLGTRQGLPKNINRINDMVVHQNTVWLIIDQALYRIHRNRALVRVPMDGHFLASNGETLFLGQRIIGTNQPIYAFQNNQWDTLPPYNLKHYRPASMAVSSDGALYVSKFNGELFRYKNGGWVNAIPSTIGITNGGGEIETSDSIVYMQGAEFMSFTRIANQHVDTLHTEYSLRNQQTTGTTNNAINFRVRGQRIYKLLRNTIIVYYPEWALHQKGCNALDVNNITLPVLSNGRVGGGLKESSNVRAGSVPVVAEISPWLRVEHENKQYLRTTLHKLAENDLYFSGPEARNVDSTYIHRYDAVWKVTRDMIEYHKTHHRDSNYTIPYAIAQWPAYGDVNNRESHELAPYVDANKNSVYDPENGDYPAVPGHQAIYTIFSPKRGNAGSMHDYHRLNIEIHLLAYAYDSAEAPELQNTVFLHYRFFNRSSSDYHKVLVSPMTHFADNHFHLTGSDSARQAWFAYPKFTRPSGETHNLPAVVVGALNTEMQGYMYFYRYMQQGDDNFRPPFTTNEYLNILNARTVIGHRVRFHSPDGPGSTSNGTGYGIGSLSKTTNWLFNSSANWYHPPQFSAPVVGIPYFNLGTIPIKSSACLSLALCIGQDTLSDAGNLVGTLNDALHHLDAVRQLSTLFPYDCGGKFISKKTHQLPTWSIYPNPIRPGEVLRIDSESELLSVELITPRGQTMQVAQTRVGNRWEISLSKGLSPGVYLLRIRMPEGVDQRKIVIQ